MRIIKVRANQAKKNKLDPHFHYCGRPCAGYSGSYLGNPYRIGKHTLEEALELYEAWLLEALRMDETVREEMQSLTADSVLGCWCCNKPVAGVPPYRCHCDIIAKVWEELYGVKEARSG